ncbi:hypothetical protein H6A13_12430 [Mordavella massiliensis]|uniref:Uncharacterized protein n=2 Tax=Mordavella massiliensis TaxID=1871024 RepID=A0A938X596_9CLOT|nr:hypothetical protein [Mordavella massiliensis]
MKRMTVLLLSVVLTITIFLNTGLLKVEAAPESGEGVFEFGENGIYVLKENALIPKGTYEVVFAGGLEDYDATGQAIELGEGPVVYNFEYFTVSISADDHGTSWIGEKGTEQKKVWLGTQVSIELE